MKEDEVKLIECASFGDLDTISELLEQGVNINTDSCSSFPLFEAVSIGNIELIKLLLKSGAIDLNRYEKSSGYTALHAAIFYSQFHNDSAILRLLLSDARVDISAPCRAPLTLGYTPLHLASFTGNPEAINALLKANADATAITEDGLSVFDVACQSTSCNVEAKQIIDLIKNTNKHFITA